MPDSLGPVTLTWTLHTDQGDFENRVTGYFVDPPELKDERDPVAILTRGEDRFPASLHVTFEAKILVETTFMRRKEART